MDLWPFFCIIRNSTPPLVFLLVPQYYYILHVGGFFLPLYCIVSSVDHPLTAIPKWPCNPCALLFRITGCVCLACPLIMYKSIRWILLCLRWDIWLTGFFKYSWLIVDMFCITLISRSLFCVIYRVPEFPGSPWVFPILVPVGQVCYLFWYQCYCCNQIYTISWTVCLSPIPPNVLKYSISVWVFFPTYNVYCSSVLTTTVLDAPCWIQNYMCLITWSRYGCRSYSLNTEVNRCPITLVKFMFVPIMGKSYLYHALATPPSPLFSDEGSDR